MLQIRLLGQFDVRLDGKRIVVPSRASQSLLAYLVMTAGTPHRREKLSGTLWPDSSDENARKNLRQELWRIRKAIPNPSLTAESDYLLSDEYTITFNRDANYWLDVAILERPDPDPQSLTSSLSLYQGEILPGFYDDWVVFERERIQSLFESKMERLVEMLVDAERWAGVQEQCERWLALGSAPEPAYRALMLSYSARGDMAKVSSVYQRCVDDLQDRFGVEPSSETHALYNGLLKGARSPRRVLPAQPSGTVTFLFTDIQGSTRLLDQLGEQYATSLAEHHRILRAAIQKWKGTEMDTQGDAFFVTFTRALDALQCAVEAQRELANHTWLQDEPIRVRMGLHTGEPLIASTGYVGMDVHRAARIGDAGHGGQVLLSQTTRDLVMQDLPAGITIKDLGEHRLKDMKYPTPIYQVVIEGLQRDFSPLKTKFTGTEAPTPGEPPFKGLQYFEEQDTDLFFGRELLTAKLLQRLRDTQFLSVVIGASGSGKSSLVRAGLLPALKKGVVLLDGTKPPDGSRDWQIHIITPTAHPLEALATELTRDQESVTATARLIDDLAQEPRSLALFLARGRRGANGHTVLVVDQFEELFTLCRDEFEREAFIDNLLNLVSPDQSNATLIITLRADFYAHLAQYPELREAVAQQQEYIGPMTTEELRRAIEEPAKRGHWEFEPGLVDLILRDIGDEPGALPLLSHALLETWKRRAGHTLTLKGYADAGGVHGAIAHTAETIYQNLSPEEQTIARDVFLRLTELGEGTEDTRRRASFAELMSHTENTGEVRAVLNMLADARLITLSEDTAEVAHEALIREWPTLREWLNQDREGLRLHRHLTEAAYEWELLGRDPGALYRGAHLVQAREWAALHPNALNAGEKAFLEASSQLEQNEIAEREAQQRRELEAAQKLADTERSRAEEQAHSANRLRIRNRVITTVGVIALVLAVLAGLFSIQSNSNLNAAQSANTQSAANEATAVANYQQAESQRLGAEGIALAQASGGSPETAALLAIHGLQMVYSPQADAALQMALPRLYTQRVFDPPMRPGPLYSIAITPDGKTLLTSDLELHDAETGKRSKYLTTNYWGTHVAFSPDGQLALAGIYGDQTARLWDAKTGKELRVFTGHTDRVLEGAFSPDGRWILTGSADQTARLWDAATGKELRVFTGHTDQVQSVVFSPDGKQVLTCSSDATVRLWDALTGQTLHIFKGHDNGVYTVTFSPDGKWILSGSSDKTARLWDVQTGRELRQFKGHSGTIRAAIFSRDGKQILTASDDTTARLWDVETGELLRVFGGHTDGVGKAVFAPDGRSVFTASWDGTIRQWTLGQDERVFTLPVLDSQSLFAPDGRTILFEGFEGNVAWLKDAHTGRELVRFSGHTADIVSILVSKDKKYVLTSSFDKTARLWDAATGQELRVFRGQTDWVVTAFSDDGRFVLTWSWAWSGDRTVRVWDAATGKQVQAIQLDQPVSMAVTSPNGKTIVIDTIDNVFSLWDMGTGKRIFREQNNSVVYDLGFSPDGKYIITSGNNKMIQLWEVATDALARTFNQPDAVNRASYSPDGKFIWSGGLDGKVRQWDATTGQLVRVFSGPRGYSGVDDISPDGKFVLIEYDDQTVHLYDVDYHDTIRYACSRLVRDLTFDEKIAYNINYSGPTCPSQP